MGSIVRNARGKADYRHDDARLFFPLRQPVQIGYRRVRLVSHTYMVLGKEEADNGSAARYRARGIAYKKLL